MRYKHKKSGDLYYLIFIAEDCTNARAGENVQVAVYRKENDTKVYCRDYEEFIKKFEKLESTMAIFVKFKEDYEDTKKGQIAFVQKELGEELISKNICCKIA